MLRRLASLGAVFAALATIVALLAWSGGAGVATAEAADALESVLELEELEGVVELADGGDASLGASADARALSSSRACAVPLAFAAPTSLLKRWRVTARGPRAPPSR